jgi:hypothetical protein
VYGAIRKTHESSARPIVTIIASSREAKSRPGSRRRINSRRPTTAVG